jgi:hypothetical protein
LVEHILGKDEVISSILIMGSSLRAERSGARRLRAESRKAGTGGLDKKEMPRYGRQARERKIEVAKLY